MLHREFLSDEQVCIFSFWKSLVVKLEWLYSYVILLLEVLLQNKLIAVIFDVFLIDFDKSNIFC